MQTNLYARKIEGMSTHHKMIKQCEGFDTI